jgi:dephospho-CoA kinase
MSVKPTEGSYLVGLTGGIGSGKSTVAGILQSLGATIVDADAISRGTTATGGTAMPAIAQIFGADFVDGTGALDRARMRDWVFADSTAKAKLEAIVHPLIHKEMVRQIEAARSHLVVLDLPLLAERTGFSGWKPKLDAVWVVDCEETTQIERVLARSAKLGQPMTVQQVQAVMRNQASRADRLAIADVVITNENIGLAGLHQVISEAIIDALPQSSTHISGSP